MADPEVKVMNSSSRNIFIDHDPNWDDQELKVDGKVISGPVQVNPDSTATASVSWVGEGSEYMIGIIFAERADYDSGGTAFFQLTVGQDPDLGVTHGGVEGEGEPHVQYTVKDPSPWSMTMEFADA